MPTVSEQVHDRLVHEVANSYRQKGFEAIVKPDPYALPELLQRFQPDLILTTPQQGHIYVEVRRKGDTRGRQYWQQLKEAIASQPDWRLQIIVRSLQEEELLNDFQPLLTPEDIEQRLNAGKQLAQERLLDSALIVTWQALEALLRRIAQRLNIDAIGKSPAALITQLTAQGDLDREDYEQLMAILPARNQAAHGHIAQNLSLTTFEQAQTIARRLLRQQRRAA